MFTNKLVDKLPGRSTTLGRACRWRTLHRCMILAALGAPFAYQAEALVPVAAAAPTLIELNMNVGEQKVISSDGVNSFSEGVKGIVDVRLTTSSDNFVIVALRPGATTLLLLMSDGSQRQYRITVADPNASSDIRAVEPENPYAVELKDNVRLDLYFLQLDQGYNHQLGIAWPAGYPSQASATFAVDLQSGALQSAALSASQLLPRLDLAQVTGHAKLVRHATVITANGTQAEFSGGGEVNIPIQNALNTGVISIKFGSTVSVLPRYDAESGRLELVVAADVADLTDDRGTGTPGRTTSRVSSVINLELGQSVMLGGLVAQSSIRSQSGLPGLSQIPVLGPLFGSWGAVDQNTENVLFIVPSVVDSVDLSARQQIQEAFQIFEDYSGDLEGIELTGPLLPPKGKGAHNASKGASSKASK